MTWFWLNMPLATVFFLAWTLIPLWLVLRHPDTGRSAAARDSHVAGPAATGGAPAPSAHAEPAAHSDHTLTHPQPKPAGHRRTDMPTAA